MDSAINQILAECQKWGVSLEVLEGERLKVKPSQPVPQSLVDIVIQRKPQIIEALKKSNCTCADCEHLEDFPTTKPEHTCSQSFRWCAQRREGRYPMQHICDGFKLKAGRAIH